MLRVMAYFASTRNAGPGSSTDRPGHASSTRWRGTFEPVDRRIETCAGVAELLFACDRCTDARTLLPTQMLRDQLVKPASPRPTRWPCRTTRR
jgi:hypothetical protein